MRIPYWRDNPNRYLVIGYAARARKVEDADARVAPRIYIYDLRRQPYYTDPWNLEPTKGENEQRAIMLVTGGKTGNIDYDYPPVDTIDTERLRIIPSQTDAGTGSIYLEIYNAFADSCIAGHML